jgi:hypothetical protein
VRRKPNLVDPELRACNLHDNGRQTLSDLGDRAVHLGGERIAAAKDDPDSG